MSHSIYLQAFTNGESQKVSTEDIVQCFEPFITKKDEFGFEVKYDELNSSFIFIDLDSLTTTDFSISRPCLDRRLFDSIIQAGKTGNFVVMEPGFDEIYVFNKATKEHLNNDLKQMSTALISSAEDFLERY